MIFFVLNVESKECREIFSNQVRKCEITANFACNKVDIVPFYYTFRHIVRCLSFNRLNQSRFIRWNLPSCSAPFKNFVKFLYLQFHFGILQFFLFWFDDLMHLFPISWLDPPYKLNLPFLLSGILIKACLHNAIRQATWG